MNITFIIAIACLALWIVFGFVIPIGIGAVHLLLAAGAVLLVRWWALRA